MIYPHKYVADKRAAHVKHLQRRQVSKNVEAVEREAHVTECRASPNPPPKDRHRRG